MAEQYSGDTKAEDENQQNKNPANEKQESAKEGTQETQAESIKAIPIYIALLPVLVLISFLSINVSIFGDDAISGSNQIVLIFCGALTAALAWTLGADWKNLEKAVTFSIRLVSPAVIILLIVGALSGTWLVSGIIPSMIYYGLYILSPEVFLVSACIICILVSLFTGSSWTTSATIGIAMMGIGNVLHIPPAWTAGAILSGAYFGDKMSPLSDTTNLASATAGVELFSHIRYMMVTTVPAIVITLFVFAIIGFFAIDSATISVQKEIQSALDASMNISPWLLLVPLLVIVMIVKKIPAIPATFVGALLGAVCAVFFQPELVRGLSENQQDLYSGLMLSTYGDTAIVTNNAIMDELLTSGGMAGMLPTIWLIIAAMIFGGTMEGSGFLGRITAALVAKAKSAFSLVSATVATCLFTNVSASDQYLAVVVPGRMYDDAYRKRGLAPQNLSRTIEDSGTVTSVLIPWNTCGAFHASVLGVATLQYLPFVFFCLLCPVLTLVVAFFQFKVEKLPVTSELEEGDQTQAESV